MKILITTFTFPPQQNGVATVAAVQAFGLAQRGHKVTIATGYDDKRRPGQLPEGIEIFQFKTFGNGNLRSGYHGEIKQYQEFIKSFDCDVILTHCWQIWSTDLACRAFTNIKAKKVLISHGVSANSTYCFPRTILHWLAWRPYVWRMSKILKSYDHVVFLTDKMNKDRFCDRLLVQKMKMTHFSIIPNGACLEDPKITAQDFRKSLNISNERIILCVSNYDPLKDQEMVLRAFLRASLEDSVLIFIGSEINHYAHRLMNIYRSAKSNLSWHPQVLFLQKQNRDMLAAAYIAADLFLLGSKSEAQPLVILDAMAAGTPFISTDVGCISELPGGIVVKSEQEMTVQMVDLLHNETKRRSLSDAGQVACRVTYNWDKNISSYDSLLTSLLKTPGKFHGEA